MLSDSRRIRLRDGSPDTQSPPVAGTTSRPASSTTTPPKHAAATRGGGLVRLDQGLCQEQATVHREYLTRDTKRAVSRKEQDCVGHLVHPRGGN